jgi:hypothetical protein
MFRMGQDRKELDKATVSSASTTCTLPVANSVTPQAGASRDLYHTAALDKERATPGSI